MTNDTLNVITCLILTKYNSGIFDCSNNYFDATKNIKNNSQELIKNLETNCYNSITILKISRTHNFTIEQKMYYK